jgi:hypothetical protein
MGPSSTPTLSVQTGLKCSLALWNLHRIDIVQKSETIVAATKTTIICCTKVTPYQNPFAPSLWKVVVMKSTC